MASRATMASDTVHAFVREHRDEILQSWEDLVVAEVRRVDLGGLALRDSIPAFLDELAGWLESGAPPGGQKLGAESLKHVIDRLDQGYDLRQVMREFRLLREAILRCVLEAEQTKEDRVGAGGGPERKQRIFELARLNAGLDVAISDSVEEFVAERDRRAAVARDREHKANELFNAVIEASPVILFTQDRELRYTWIPQPAPGYRPEDVIGKTDYDVLERRADADAFVALKRRALDTGQAVRDIVPALHHGVVRWYDTHVRPQHGSDGNLVGVLVAAVEVTERKRAEDALRRTESVLQYAGAMARLGAWWVDISDPRDLNANPLRWSDEVYRLFGYEPGGVEVSNALFFAHVHQDDRPRVAEAVAQALATRMPYCIEHRIVRRDGTERVVFEYGSFEFDDAGTPVRLVGAVQDVTDTKRAEDALREADRRKDEFLAVLSHELRNPLAPIKNSLYLLDRAAPGSETFVRARHVIERQTDHLTRLIGDLLDVVRITKGRIELQRERVDLRDLVRQAMDDVRPSFAHAGIELRVEHALGPTWVDADRTRIAQIVWNLLHNAQKFTPAGGTVTVSLACDSGTAYLRVKDTGVGMEPGHEHEMFEAFAQGDQGLARTKGGLGLGLSLVKTFVEMHGGTVSATSEGKGRGTEFVLTLPLATSGAPQTRATEGREVPARRILVVEDNNDAAQTLADVLALNGHTVEVATTGTEGVAMAREHRPDVVLCDIGLPDIDGYEVARQVRATPGLEKVRLVALTGYALSEDRERARKAGFHAHLAKPPDLEELERLLRGES